MHLGGVVACKLSRRPFRPEIEPTADPSPGPDYLKEAVGQHAHESWSAFIDVLIITEKHLWFEDRYSGQ